MSKSKNGWAATVFTVLAFIFVLIAFTTPYWLETDGKLERPKFIRLGLWEVCLNEFRDPKLWYDTLFTGCMWVFEEEYMIIHDLLLPGFFVAVQFFFTLCFTLLLIGSFMVAIYWCTSSESPWFVKLLIITGIDHILAGFCGTIAVIIFGARGDGRDWMPNWEHNNPSWSYALAVFGALFLYFSGVLFIVEGKVRYKKRKHFEAAQAAYHMEQVRT